jgi:hypothetical protein
MKEINWNKIKKQKAFQVSPHFKFERDLQDLVDDFKIKIIAYEDEPEVIIEIFKLMNIYFSKEVIDKLAFYMKPDTIRHLKIMQILDYENKENL